jgi:hypothetical protein
MATKAQILAAAKKVGVNLTNPAKVTAFVTCVSVAASFTSLPNAVKKCAQKLGML